LSIYLAYVSIRKINQGGKIMSSIGEKMSIAIEILSMKLSKDMFNKEKVNKIFKEKELVYSGDIETIEKVINVYGKELKEEMQNG